MAFPKGVSGNPNGRPKKDPVIEKAIKAAAKGTLDNIKALANSSSDDAIKLKANTWLFERAHGKATENIELETSGPLVAIIKDA